MNRLFKSFLVFLLTYTQAFADAPVIWNGAWSKNLTQNGFLMNNNQVVTTDGLINYVKNGHGEVGTSGWSVYSDAAGTAPVDCTGGSPTETITQSASSPLIGTGSLVLTKGASNSQGQGASYPFTIDAAYKSTPLQIKVTALGSANYAASDVGVYIYDVTNSTLITPAAVNIAAGTFTLNSFFVATTSTSYRLCIHTQTTNANAYTLQLDSVSVGPQSIAVGAPLSGWQTWNSQLTYTNFGTTSGEKVYSKRISDSLFIWGYVVSGAAAGTVSFDLPSGLTINYSALPTTTNAGQVGTMFRLTPGTSNSVYADGAVFLLFADGTTTNKIFVARNNNSTAVFSKYSSPTNNGDGIQFAMSIPIAEWAGSANNSIQGDRAVEEYAYNTSTADSDDTTSFGYGPAGTQFGSYTAVRSKTVQFQYAVQPTDRLILEVTTDNISWLDVNLSAFNSTFVPYTIQNSTAYGVGFIGSTSNQVLVKFGTYRFPTSTYGAAGGAWSGISGTSTYRWRMRKISGGALTGYPIANSNQVAINSASEYSANTRLGQMQYVSGTSYNGGNSPTITASTWTTTRGVFIPYQMADGTWRCRFNFWGTTTSSTKTNVTWTVNGLTFITVSGGGQSCSGNAGLSSGAAVSLCVANSNASTIDLYHASATTTTYGVSADVELASKPTWAY